jgi:hypothetical protein
MANVIHYIVLQVIEGVVQKSTFISTNYDKIATIDN